MLHDYESASIKGYQFYELDDHLVGNLVLVRGHPPTKF